MNGILLSCEIEGINTRRDKTLKITLGTQELTPANGAQVLGLMNKMAVVYISPKETIDQKEMDQVDQINPEFGGKTPSQRLRGVLFVAFHQNKEGFKDFESYYRYHIESFINGVKSKLSP